MYIDPKMIIEFMMSLSGLIVEVAFKLIVIMILGVVIYKTIKGR